ncbi:MAG TPA: hypothetical protein VNW92_20915 [Polyangiaceae bacterium]|nr:hypothetical protein [Polyangiaceae bacterium]
MHAGPPPLENATATGVGPGAYEITISRLSPIWHVSGDLFDGALLRVDGFEIDNVVDMPSNRDKLVLLATAHERTPPPSRAA